MKVALCSLNVSFIHKNLALRWLMVSKPESIEARVFEATTENYDQCIKDIVEYQADVLGLSCYIFNIEATKQFILKIKEYLPECRIILGGPEVSFNPDPMFDYPIDGIIVGEGEFAFWDAVQKKETLGYQTEKNEKVEYLKTDLRLLETLQSPYFLDFDQKDMGKRYLYVETSRGCPYGCAYCMASLDRKVRLFSQKYMDTFFDQLKETDVKQVKFLDRTFNVEPKRALRLGYQCLSMPESMHFHVELVGDTLHEDLIHFFQNDALERFRMEIGVQSFQDKTLKAVGRTCNLDKLSQVIEGFAQKKAHQHTDLIAGLPFETLDLFKISYQKLIYLKPFEIQVGILKLLHGTSLFQLKDVYGYEADLIAPYQITKTKWMSFEEIKQVEYCALATEKCYNSQRLKSELDALFQDESIVAFDVMAECGYAIAQLNHPYQVKDFYQALYPVLSKYTDRAQFLIEKAYYRQAKVKPSLIYPIEQFDLNFYRKALLKITEQANKAVFLMDDYVYAILYQNQKQIWYTLNREGTCIDETVISYTK